MAEGLQTFTDAAKAMSGSPLGIVALFIVLIYGIVALVIATTSSFTANERLPLIYCMSIFPFAVLGVFGWLVSQHATNLYSPKDFKDENNYVQMQLAVLLGAAAGKDPSRSGGSLNVGSIIKIASQSSSKIKTESKTLLWVDDNPDNNLYERGAFEKAGFQISLALSTEQALSFLKKQDYSVIISDMTRKEGPTEGYNLLSDIRSQGIKTPFFVYSTANGHEVNAKLTSMGGQGSTNSPLDLFQMVSSAVQ